MAQQIDFNVAYGRPSPIASLSQGIGQGLEIADRRNAYQAQLQQLRMQQQEQNQKDVLSALDVMGKMPQSARPGTYESLVLPAAKKAGINLPSEYQQDYNPLFDDASKLIEQKKANKIDDKTLKFGLSQIQLQFAKMGDYKSADLMGSLGPKEAAPLSESKQATINESKQRRVEGIINRFNADPEVRKQNARIDFSNDVIGLVLSGNPIAAGAIPTFMARGSGEVGALSESDKAPFGGSRAILSRLQQSFQQAVDGKLTPNNQKFLTDLSRTFINSAEKNLNRVAVERSKQYSKNSDVFSSPEELFQTLRPEGTYSETGKGAVKEEQRRTKDGKIAIFDMSKNPPEFLRYQ